MIDLNKIRSSKTLEEMKKFLNDFLTAPGIVEVYEQEYGWSQEDYEADKDDVKDLLERLEQRIKSLQRFESKNSKSSLKNGNE